MNLDHDFVQLSKFSEDQKVKVFAKMEHFFSQIQVKTKRKKKPSPKMVHFFCPNSRGHLRSDAHQSQIIGRDAVVYHTQTIGGDTVKLLEGYIPHPPLRVSAPLSAGIYVATASTAAAIVSHLERF